MLNQTYLDNETYEQIVGQAKRSIPEICPRWTDHNVHDPGVMLLELFAYLTEMQRFYMDQSETAEAFMPLLGIAPKPVMPSYCRLAILRDKDGCEEFFGVPEGNPVMAEDVRFETAFPFTFGERRRILEVTSDEVSVQASDLTLFYPFGESPEPGKSFSIFLETPPNPGRMFTIEFALFHPDGFERNAIDLNSPPKLANIVWEQRTRDGYRAAHAEDYTFGLLTSGVARFTFREKFLPDDRGRYEIKATLLDCDYDVAPCIEGIQPAVFTAKQRHTICEDIDCGSDPSAIAPNTWLPDMGDMMLFADRGGRYTRIRRYEKGVARDTGLSVFSVAASDIPAAARAGGDTDKCSFRVLSCDRESGSRRLLGEADGFPNLRFEVDTGGETIIENRFSVIVADSYDINYADRWERTDNFLTSRPTDRHYMLDEAAGVVTFGDGTNGAMPKGVVLCSSLLLTRGEHGNITTGQITDIVIGERRLELEQQAPSIGGSGREPIGASIRRAQAEYRNAVTAGDVEALVMGVPGLAIAGVHAYRKERRGAGGPPLISVAVRPAGPGRPMLTGGYARHIREYLEPHRLVGTDIEIIPARYARVDVLAEVTAPVRGRNIEGDIRSAVAAYFAERSGFEQRLSRGELHAEVESLSGVEHVTSVSLSTTSNFAARDATGNIRTAENAIPYMGTVKVLVR